MRRVWLRDGDQSLGGSGQWREYITATVMFGDSLGGFVASCAIKSAIQSHGGVDLESEVRSLTLMDDLGISSEKLKRI